jgi:hypothetical protein
MCIFPLSPGCPTHARLTAHDWESDPQITQILHSAQDEKLFGLLF